MQKPHTEHTLELHIVLDVEQVLVNTQDSTFRPGYVAGAMCFFKIPLQTLTLMRRIQRCMWIVQQSDVVIIWISYTLIGKYDLASPKYISE